MCKKDNYASKIALFHGQTVLSKEGVSPMLSKVRKKTETIQAKKFLSARKKVKRSEM